ncbi:MAG: YcgL domain-containing protein [Gammaproteobacteria bacterium]|jgi:uncharacterized protein YcgL (UPF0745 family)|nr:YcgL domain-containing protein [Gammaproteobacteria bacterium]MBT5682654.1 YcgL domain-containing protein [Gammaproteobacteria bacterium]MBT6025057.1 YcgL domain-containing protein [Gammaproteobacteria bacterium]MBT6558711.1 YcgL domain-containing protein [Gammaproteobacteria bacterium]
MTVDGTNKASLESSKEVSVASLSDIEVKIFRSSKKMDTYIYLPIEAEFDDLPEALRKQFGRTVFVMELLLTTSLKLALFDAATVMQGIAKDGFFLQFPPPNLSPVLPEELLE